jgi:CheY-like chemotaxis protein
MGLACLNIHARCRISQSRITRGATWRAAFKPVAVISCIKGERMANVLLVDDDANVLQALETMLVLQGHRVRTAESGASALNAVRLDAPEIIVTDVMMPDMDGIRLLRTLRSTPRFADIPVILMTAINVPQDLPVQASLRKPYSAAHLVDLISKLLA